MSILERAYLTVVKQAKNYILLFLFFVMIIHIVVGGIIISKVTLNIGQRLAQQIGVRANSFINKPLDIVYVISDIHAVGQLPYITNYNYNRYLDLQFTQIDGEITDDYIFRGINDLTFFKEHELYESISAGRELTDNDKASPEKEILVSNAILERYNLEIGAQIDFTFIINNLELNENGSIYSGVDVLENNNYTFKIIGTFMPKKSTIMNFLDEELENHVVFIYNTDLEELSTFQIDTYKSNYDHDLFTKFQQTIIRQYKPVYNLAGLNYIEPFKMAVKSYPAFAQSELEIDATNLQKVANSLEIMNGLSRMIVIGCIVASLVIIISIVMVFIQNRKYELAVILSLGEKKFHICLQLICEGCIVFWFASLISFLSCNFFTQKLTQFILNEQINITDVIPTLSTELAINTTITWYEYFGLVTGGYTIIIFLAVGISSFRLSQMSPRKIML